MQTGARRIQIQLGRIVHDGELNLVFCPGFLKPALMIGLFQPGHDRFLDDALTVRHGMQHGIQAVAFYREGTVPRDELLPRQGAYALEQIVERLGAKGAQPDQHPFCTP